MKALILSFVLLAPLLAAVAQSADEGAAISAVPLLLEKVRQERNLQLRGVAAKAAVRIDPTQLQAVAGILEVGSRSKDLGIRLFALQALIEIDAELAFIVPILKRMQSDEIIDIQLMAQQPLILRSIDDLRVFKGKDALRARAHISTAPKGRLGLDLMFRDGKWWMTGG